MSHVYQCYLYENCTNIVTTHYSVVCCYTTEPMPELSSGICDFEGAHFCGYTQDTDDDFDWIRNSGETETDETGPSVDHTYESTSIFKICKASVCVYHILRVHSAAPFFLLYFFSQFDMLKGTNGRQKTYEIFHVFMIFYSGFMCQTTVIFGITKDGSLVLNPLAS